MTLTRTGRRKILVVEDDGDLAGLLKKRLVSEGFEVQTEPSGKAALCSAAESPPDLVILDLKLPDISGHQVCRQLQESFAPEVMPILMLTGMDQPVDRLRGLAFGADAYFTKPYQPAELLKTIHHLLGEWDYRDPTPIRYD